MPLAGCAARPAPRVASAARAWNCRTRGAMRWAAGRDRCSCDVLGREADSLDRRLVFEQGQHRCARIVGRRIDALLLHQHAADLVGIKQVRAARRAVLQMGGSDHRQRRRQRAGGIAEHGGVVEMMVRFHRGALMLPCSLRERAPQRRFDRAQRHVQLTRDLAVALAFQVTHANQFGLHGRKAVDRLFQHVLVERRFGLRVAPIGLGMIEPVQPFLDRQPVRLLAHVIDIQIARHAIQPGGEAGTRRIEQAGLAPQRQQCLLHQLFCHRLGHAKIAQIALQTRREMIVDAHETGAVALQDTAAICADQYSASGAALLTEQERLVSPGRALPRQHLI